MNVTPFDGAPELNRAEVENLARAILNVYRAHYRSRQPSRINVFELVNATAFALAAVLQGAGEDTGTLRDWFESALDPCLAQLAAAELGEPRGLRQ
jgi:hypothetical protein